MTTICLKVTFFPTQNDHSTQNACLSMRGYISFNYMQVNTTVLIHMLSLNHSLK